MKGFLKQITNANGELLGLYLFYEDMDEEKVASLYREYDDSDESVDMDFDEWLVDKEGEIAERVYADEVYIL